MPGFDYVRPESREEALEFLAEHGDTTKILAGGTDLLVQFRNKPEDFSHLNYVLDSTFLKDMDFVEEKGEEIHLGPLTTYETIGNHGLLQKEAPFLGVAARAMGSPQIRSRATLGGNIANACPAADAVYPLLALNATIRVEQAGGGTWRPLSETITGPYTNSLSPRELITGICFKKLPAGTGFGFTRLARRQALAIARLNVAVLLQVVNGCIEEIRIAPGAVLPVPGRVEEAEAVLKGQMPKPELIEEAGQAVARKMVETSGRRWSTEFKEPVIAVLTQRAITQALGVETP